MTTLRFVYVVATSYSGTTLLSVLMNAHPEIASIGELGNSLGNLYRQRKIKKYHCSCGNEISQCHYWKEIKQHCSDQGLTLDLYNFKTKLDLGMGDRVNRILFGVPDRFTAIGQIRNNLLWIMPGPRQMLRRVMNRNLIIASAILRVTGKKVFFDSSKKVTSAHYYSKNGDIDFKMIHLVRDPRGVLNSAMKRNKYHDTVETMKYWRGVHGSALELKRSLNENSYLLINYERLCSHTRETLDEICRFIEVEPFDLSKAADQQENHIIGNKMRRQTFTGLKHDESWKDKLTAEQIITCKQITGDLGVKFGYSY